MRQQKGFFAVTFACTYGNIFPQIAVFTQVSIHDFRHISYPYDIILVEQIQNLTTLISSYLLYFFAFLVDFNTEAFDIFQSAVVDDVVVKDMR